MSLRWRFRQSVGTRRGARIASHRLLAEADGSWSRARHPWPPISARRSPTSTLHKYRRQVSQTPESATVVQRQSMVDRACRCRGSAAANNCAVGLGSSAMIRAAAAWGGWSWSWRGATARQQPEGRTDSPCVRPRREAMYLPVPVRARTARVGVRHGGDGRAGAVHAPAGPSTGRGCRGTGAEWAPRRRGQGAAGCGALWPSRACCRAQHKWMRFTLPIAQLHKLVHTELWPIDVGLQRNRRTCKMGPVLSLSCKLGWGIVA